MGLSTRRERSYRLGVVLRLFSTFPRGAPGIGLLLLRLAVGLAVGVFAVMALRGGLPIAPSLFYGGLAVLGFLLLAGLWTPIAGAILALAALGNAIVRPEDRWSWVILAVLAAALGLLGPGAWSVDARIYGWRRLEIPDRKSDDKPPI
jgi:putative oxidoreductase